MNLLTLPIIIVAGVPVLGTILSVVYGTAIQPIVRLWFGDEPGQRWNREARRRRQDFEKTCGFALSCMLFSIVAGAARLLVIEHSVELSRLLLFVQLGLIAVMIFFIWTAVSQWKQPFEN